MFFLFVVVDQHLDANHGFSQVSSRRRLPRLALPPARPVLMPRANHGGNQRILVPIIATGEELFYERTVASDYANLFRSTVRKELRKDFPFL